MDALERRLLLSTTLPSFVQASTDANYNLDNSSGSMVMDLNSGSLVVNADLSTASGWSNATVRLHGDSQIYLNAPQKLADLELHDNSAVEVALANASTPGNPLPYGNFLQLNGFAMDSTATLDLANNSMVLYYAPSQEAATKSLIGGLLKSGYAAGHWDGTGINSSAAATDSSQSTALGFIDNNDIGVTSFDGINFSDGNQIFVRYTVYGDTDLDGKIGASDSANMSTGVHGGTGWEFGDFNYDGWINNVDQAYLSATPLPTISAAQYTPALQVQALPFTAYSYTGWSGDIATFTDCLHSGAPASDYVATVDWNDGTITDAQVTSDSSDSGLRVNVDLPAAPSSSVFTVHVAYDPTGPDQYIGAATSASAVVTLNQLPPGAVASPDAVYTLSGVASAATLDLTAGSIAFNSDVAYEGNYWQNLNFTLSGSAHAYFNSPEDFNALTIQGNAIVSLSMGGGGSGGNRLNVQSLSIDPNATLDLADNALIDWYAIGGGAAARSQMQSWLKSGYASGAWTGTGIDSSVAAADKTDTMALGWMDNGYDYVDHSIDPSYLTFAGVNLQQKNQMLVRLAYYGDANLDGQVDDSDLYLWRYGYNKLGYTGWVYGDFNYDGQIDNTADLNIWNADYGLTLNGPNFAPAFLPTGIVINPIEGVPFSGDLATFYDILNPSNTDPSIYLAQVDWGDGFFYTAQVTATSSPGYFRINALSPALTDPNAVMTVTIKYADMNDPSPTYQGRPAAVSEPITMTPAVANLLATAVSTSQIDLAWSLNAPNASAIEVDRSTDGINWETLTGSLSGTATSYSDSTGLTDATHYCYRIRAIWSAGTSAFTATADAWTLPNAPSGLSVASSGVNEVDLSWTNNSTVATQFQIERSDDGTNFYTLDTTTGTTYADTFADDGSTYWYRVEALNDNGDLSAPSDASSASTALAAPSELTATAVSASEIDLAWSDDSVTATGYELDRSTDGVNFTSLAANLSGDTTSYSDTGLAPGSHFYYRVISLAGSQVSAPSNYANDTTTPPSPDSAWTTTTSSSVTLNWTPAQGASGYEVDRSVNGAWVNVGDMTGGSTTTFTDTGLLENTSFSYQIIASNNAGQSSPTPVAATTSLETPAAPSGVQSIALSPTSVEIIWENNADNETSFNIGYNTDGTSTYTPIGSTGAGVTQFIATNLSPNTGYFFAVQAANSDVASGWSGTSSITTPNLPAASDQAPQAPTNLKATATTTLIQLSWTASQTLGVEYWVEREMPGGSNWGVIGIAVGTTYNDDPELTGVNFNYRVVAATDEFTSVATNIVSVMKPWPAPTINLQLYTWSTDYKATLFWDPPVDPNSVDGYSFSYTTSDGATNSPPIKVSDHAVTVAAPNGDHSFTYTLIVSKGSSYTTYTGKVTTVNDPSGNDVSSVSVDSQGILSVSPSTVSLEYTDDPTGSNWLGVLGGQGSQIPLGMTVWVRSSTREGTVIPLDDPALPQPGGLNEGTTGAESGYDELYYQWGALVSNASAEVELSMDGKNFFDFGTAGGNQIDFDEGVDGPTFEGQTFIAQVRQYQNYGTNSPTGYSEWQNYGALDAMPAAPLKVTATAGAGVAHLLWAEGSEGESSQVIECSTNWSFTAIASSVTVAPDTTSYDYGSLAPGNYFFRIKEVSGTPASGDTPAIPGADSPWSQVAGASVTSASVAISSVDNAAELGPDNHPQDGYFEISRSGSTSFSLTVNVDLSGTAAVGTQYTTDAGGASPVQVTIPAGASAAFLVVEPLLDGLDGPATTNVVATIEPPAGATVGTGTATLNIAELPTLQGVTVTDTGRSSNAVTVTDSTPKDLYVLKPQVGTNEVEIHADFTKPTAFAGAQVLWSVSGLNNSAKGKSDIFWSPQVFGDPKVTLTPTQQNWDFVVTVGVDTNGDGQLQAGEVQRTIRVHVFQPQFVIASGQIPGAQVNYLDGHSGVNARTGMPKTYLLMGTDAADVARVNVTLNYLGTPPPSMLFALTTRTATTFPNLATVAGKTATFAVTSASNSDITSGYSYVDYGVDLNGDGKLSSDEVLGQDPRPLSIISQKTSNADIKALKVIQGTWSRTVSTAANFLFCFLNDFAPANAVNASVTLAPGNTSLPHQLHHNVGVAFTVSGGGPIDDATFSSTSNLANEIVESNEMQKKVQDWLTGKDGDVIKYMTANPTVSTTWITWDTATDAEMAKYFGSISLKSNLDLYLSIGDATLSGMKVAVRVVRQPGGGIVADSVIVTGILSDIYDFDYDFPLFGQYFCQWGAAVQARYNRIGDAGHVFEEHVDLNNSMGLTWDVSNNIIWKNEPPPPPPPGL